jgi:hypothetical protein
VILPMRLARGVHPHPHHRMMTVRGPRVAFRTDKFCPGQNAQWSSLFLTGSQRYVSEFTPHEHLSPGGMSSLMYSFMSPRVQRSLDEPCYSRGVT